MSPYPQTSPHALQGQALLELTRTGIDRAASDLSSLAERHVRFSPHTSLYRQGEAPHHLYVLQQGLVKTHVDSESGREQVCAFHYPGDVLGLGALSRDCHTASATAITQTHADALSLQRLHHAIRRDTHWATCLLDCTTRALAEAQESLALIGSQGGEARVATFLLIQSLRAGQGAPSASFHLAMTRADMAHYLGLTKESTCRLLAGLQRRGLIECHQKAVSIRDFAGLAEAAGVGSLAGVRHAA